MITGNLCISLLFSINWRCLPFEWKFSAYMEKWLLVVAIRGSVVQKSLIEDVKCGAELSFSGPLSRWLSLFLYGEGAMHLLHEPYSTW